MQVQLPSSNELLSRVDDLAGGPLQVFKRRLKFRLRYHLHHQTLQYVVEGFARCGMNFMFETDPRCVIKPLRSYLWSEGLNPDRRARLLIAHCEWLRKRGIPTQLETFYREGFLPVLSWHVRDGEGPVHTLSLDIRPGRTLGREGDMELHLRLDGVAVMRAAFSVLPAAALGEGHLSSETHLMVVGCLQGADAGAEQVREMTQWLQRVRPRDVMLNLLQGLAAGWGLVGVRGVSRRAHVYATYRSLSRRVALDYDAMWQELGATECPQTHWVLPAVPQVKDLADVPSRKRAEYRRRTALRQQLFQACAQQAAAGFTGGSLNPLEQPLA